MLKGNILVVDDEVVLLENIADLIKPYADGVHTAENGVQALKIVEQSSIHLIVSDIKMPKMDGIELIKAIREKQDNTPFIFFTAHGNYDLMMEAAKFGAYDFIDKPNLDGLEETVERALKDIQRRYTGSEFSPTIDPQKFQEHQHNEYQKILKAKK